MTISAPSPTIRPPITKHDQTVGSKYGELAIKQLRDHLHKREHEAFLSAFRAPTLLVLAMRDNYLKALGGEALCVLLEEVPEPPPDMLRHYEALLLDGALLVPCGVVLDLARRLKSKPLQLLGERVRLLENRLSRAKPREPVREEQIEDLKAPVIEVRRFVQSTFMEFTPRTAAETLGMRKSIFRSEQERAFQKALSLRFPALLALPNYALDQIAELSSLRKYLGERVWSYGRHCRIDALLVLPDEGRPVAAFELDSGYHDQPEAQFRDEMKNAIFRLLGMPFFRLRVESPSSTTSDEWYAILTDEVVPRLDLGRRLHSQASV